MITSDMLLMNFKGSNVSPKTVRVNTDIREKKNRVGIIHSQIYTEIRIYRSCVLSMSFVVCWMPQRITAEQAHQYISGKVF